MKHLAAMMMFAAWLLYGAMPAMAVPGMVAMPTAAAMSVETSPGDHAQHHDMKAGDDQAKDVHAGHAHEDMSKPCPHGSGNGCVAPFCAACLVLLPDMAFAEADRFVHPTPEPEAGPALVVPASRPPTPPPRA